MSHAVHVAPASRVFIILVGLVGSFVPETYATESPTTEIPHIRSGASRGRSVTNVQVAPPSEVKRS
jgi:hypothetical protein